MTDQTRIRAAEAALAQVGALCWRMRGGKARVLMVTSRDTGRWVIPKGWPMQGRTASAAAQREAWEEAGVEGDVTDASLGRYSYIKTRPGADDATCEVEVFPLRVQRLERRFPERAERRRKWFAAEKAARRVAEPELRALILAFAASAGAAAAGD